MANKLLSFLLLFIIGCGTTHTHKQEEIRTESNAFKIVELKNEQGCKVEITNYGARLVSWYVKDKNDSLRNIVLGFSTLQQYQNADAQYYGAIVGRYANRLQNFELEGKKIHLTEDEFILHGGKAGFHDKFWSIEAVTKSSVKLKYLSKDGEGGFPGNLEVVVEYQLTENNELKMNYNAVTDKATVVNLTNHAFFNLKGAGNGSVLDLNLRINADQYTPLISGGLPTGEIKAVDYSVFDFRTMKTVRSAIDTSDAQIKLANGIDHNFVKKNDKLPLITAIDPQSGIKMEMHTTMPGVQVYTANFLSGNDKSDTGKAFKARESICFESQFYPDSPQHTNFPSVVLQPEETYQHSTIYKVSVEEVELRVKS
ncbi:aldose epimerase family protein [Flammeovirga aprica]|uniref:Aldose 1-epimerase n=1 Tax=Flammeovirga aprica JL-4 TaxID=694437 RepID=A0A7X9RV74_9BACT|nr:aldose epimerase family protein [Flammeovirga aprica]NME69306.1 galactose mutarotase [Flammeovirga aprica JL-4]